MLLPDPVGIVTLTTDFGIEDHYVGVMKGVVYSIFPAARIVDVTHSVAAQQVEQGAFFLAQAYRFFPAGSVHLAVVDPGVGSQRRALAVAAGGHYFIAPDNGLLSHVLERESDSRALELDADRYGLSPRSNTFHGRDVFAPAAAWLAQGKPFAEFGRDIDDPVRLSPSAAQSVGPGLWKGRVLSVDHFGNVVTNFGAELLDESSPFTLTIEDLEVRRFARSYAAFEDYEPYLIAGSSGYLEISARGGAADLLMDAWLGDPIMLQVGAGLELVN